MLCGLTTHCAQLFKSAKAFRLCAFSRAFRKTLSYSIGANRKQRKRNSRDGVKHAPGAFLTLAIVRMTAYWSKSPKTNMFGSSINIIWFATLGPPNWYSDKLPLVTKLSSGQSCRRARQDTAISGSLAATERYRELAAKRSSKGLLALHGSARASSRAAREYGALAPHLNALRVREQPSIST